MPRQNRVTPGGDLIAVSARGAWLGNRGILHDDSGTVVRRHASERRWITCTLEGGGTKRPLAAPGQYTPLFFLDEVTAFAAGHRPCAQCRRADYRRFAHAWTHAHPQAPVSATVIDARLHQDRLHNGRQRQETSPCASLPSGAFVLIDGQSWLVGGALLRRWTPDGYAEPMIRPVGPVTVLTPSAIVAVLRAGYAPQLHRSIGATG